MSKSSKTKLSSTTNQVQADTPTVEMSLGPLEAMFKAAGDAQQGAGGEPSAARAGTGLFGGAARRQRERQLETELRLNPFRYKPDAGAVQLASFTERLAHAVLDGKDEEARQIARAALFYAPMFKGVDDGARNQFEQLAPNVVEGFKDGSFAELATLIRSGLQIDRDNAVGRQLLNLIDGPADKTNGMRLGVVKHPNARRMGQRGSERKRLERQINLAKISYSHCQEKTYKRKMWHVSKELGVSEATVKGILTKELRAEIDSQRPITERLKAMLQLTNFLENRHGSLAVLKNR